MRFVIKAIVIVIGLDCRMLCFLDIFCLWLFSFSHRLFQVLIQQNRIKCLMFLLLCVTWYQLSTGLKTFPIVNLLKSCTQIKALIYLKILSFSLSHTHTHSILSAKMPKTVHLNFLAAV